MGTRAECRIDRDPDPATNAHRKLINELAARYRLPVIHPLRTAAADGGLISYGVDLPTCSDRGGICRSHPQRRQARRLPISLRPFELVINLTTAKTLGIDVPMSLMVRADEMLD